MSAPRADRRAAARWLTPGAVVLAAALTGYGARTLWPKAAPQVAAQVTAQAAVPVYTAPVVRTSVEQRQVVGGTIGYQGAYVIADALPAGVITGLPRPGRVITRGQILYQVAGQPATLCYGGVPAWRDIGPDSAPGPDIRELDENLNALGYHAGTPADTLTWGAVVAIERWQLDHGRARTGTITLGQIAFLPGPVRITGTPASTGTLAAPGAQLLTGTSTTPAVTVNLTPGSSPARRGDPVQVTLPGNTTVNGHVLTVGAVTQGPPAPNQGPSAAIIPVTIGLDGYRLPADLDQAPVQVIMTEQTDPDVLAVPVTALLAQPGGGYAVRTAAHRTIAVNVGIYDDTTGLVEVSGAGLAAGLTVQVAEG